MTPAHEAELEALWAVCGGEAGGLESAAARLAGGWRVGQVRSALRRLGLMTAAKGRKTNKGAVAEADASDGDDSGDDGSPSGSPAPRPPPAPDSPGARERARRAALDALRAKRGLEPLPATVEAQTAAPAADTAPAAPAPAKKRRLKRIGQMAAPVRAAYDSDSD